jgi:hypothetical protein
MALCILIALVVAMPFFVWAIRKFNPLYRQLIFLAVIIGSNICIYNLKLEVNQSDFIRNFHGQMNTNVGLPYADLIKYLNGLAKTGEFEQLKQKLAILDQHSRDIYDAWLLPNNNKFKIQINQTTEKPELKQTKNQIAP